MVTRDIGQYQQMSPEQQALLYASGYRYTSDYVISQTQQPGMRPLPPPALYRPGVTEAELSQRVATQREQEYRIALELQQARQASRASFGGTFTPSSLEMALAPVGTSVASEIRRMPIEQEQIGLKLQYLQSPTAQWGSEAGFKQAISGVERFAPAGTEFKGTIVGPPISQQVPTPFEAGGVQYGKLLESRIQPLPSTPIDYSRTHVSELYSWPVYKGAAFVSRGLQTGLEFGIDIQPFPKPVKEVQKGVVSLVTGIPEFFASGLAGYEYAAREPEVFKAGIVPAGKMFGAGLVQQATERPYFTLGQAAGVGYGMRGLVKTPSVSGLKTGIREFRVSEAAELFPKKRPVSQIQLLERPKAEYEKPVEVIDVRNLIPEKSKPIAMEKPKFETTFETETKAMAERQAPLLKAQEAKYGKLSGVALMKAMKAEATPKPFSISLSSYKLLPTTSIVSGMKSMTIQSPISISKAMPISIQRPIAIQRAMPIQISRQMPIQTPKAVSSMMPIATAIQIPVQRAISIQKTELINSQRTKITYGIRPTMDLFKPTKVKTPKTTSDIFGFGKKGRKGRRGGFKFPELTRVTTPKQIMKGFRL